MSSCLCGVSGDVPPSRYPVAVEAWFDLGETEGDERIVSGDFRRTREDLEKGARAGEITLLRSRVDLSPVKDGFAVLVDESRTGTLSWFREGNLHEGHVAKCQILDPDSLQPTQTVFAAYGSTEFARKVLHRIARDYYLEACEAIGRGNLDAASASLLVALRAQPTFPHVALLAARIADERSRKELGAFRELLFRSASRLLGGASLAEMETLAVSLRFWVAAVNARWNAPCVPDLLRGLPYHCAAVLKMPTDARILDLEQRKLRKLGVDLAREGRWDSRPAEAAAKILEKLYEENHRRVNVLMAAACYEWLARSEDAKRTCEEGLKANALAPSTPEPETFLLRTAEADANRIIGRIQFKEGNGAEARKYLATAETALLELEKDARQKMRFWVWDRLAQVELMLGVLDKDLPRVRLALNHYETLEEITQLTPYGIFQATLAAIATGELERGKHFLREYQKLPFARPKRIKVLCEFLEAEAASAQAALQSPKMVDAACAWTEDVGETVSPEVLDLQPSICMAESLV